MNVLFLHGSRFQSAPWRDGSTRYRCYHQAEALQRMGHIADVCHLQACNLATLSRYDVVSVLRPHPSRKLDRLRRHCRVLGIHFVADVDDLVFVPDLACQSPSVLNGQASESAVRRRYQSQADTLQCFDEITVATTPLAVAWQTISQYPPATVVHNGLSDSWLARPGSHKTHAAVKNGALNITYLPGTRSHDHDFAEITDVLAEALNRHPRATLMIVGALAVDKNRFPAARVQRAPWTDYQNLPALIEDSHITIAPLANTPFNQAKSHIKFIESAAFGTPVVCSPNADLCRHNTAGLTIADNEQAWHSALDTLLSDAATHDTERTGDSLRQYARQHCRAHLSATKQIEHWSAIRTDLHDSDTQLPRAS